MTILSTTRFGVYSMKILIAVDSFKGSNSAANVAHRIACGIMRVAPDASIKELPIADGGEGTIDALLSVLGGRREAEQVLSPAEDHVWATYGILPSGTVVLETAQSSGLTLVPAERLNPLLASSYGTGQLLRSVISRGYRDIIIGLGGSATNDGGAGMLQALGVSLRNEQGDELAPGGGALAGLAEVDISGLMPELRDTKIRAICDVRNPLCGVNGASAVFGPQKGATPAMVQQLDDNLAHFAAVIKRQMGIDLLDISGGGAAGGIGASLSAFCGAVLCSGINTVLDAVGFEQQLQGTDLVITGEGKIDGQSMQGKVPYGVATRVKAFCPDIGVVALVGDIGPGAEELYCHGIDCIMSTVNRAMPLSEAMAESGRLLEDAGERMMRLILLGRNSK